MLICLSGGTIVDPTRAKEPIKEDLWIGGDRIVAPPTDGRPADFVHDVSGHVLMAGAIDIHTHIAGGKVNLGRLLSARDQLLIYSYGQTDSALPSAYIMDCVRNLTFMFEMSVACIHLWSPMN